MKNTTSKAVSEEDHPNCTGSNYTDNQNGNELESTFDPRLREAENYYKYISEHLNNEVQMYEEKLKNIQQTNQALKQNLIDMDKEKQRIIVEFHERYRKLSVNVELVHQIETDLQRLKEFLENAKELVNDLQTSKDEGINQRKYILETYQRSFEELTKIEGLYKKKMETTQTILDHIQQEVKKQHTYNILNEELTCYIKICQGKQNQINTTLQTVLESCNKMEIEIVEIQNKTKSAANNAKQKFFNLAEQVKTEVQTLFISLDQLKNEVGAEFATKQAEICQFKTKTNEQILSIMELDNAIEETNNEIHKLENEIEQRKNKYVETKRKLQKLKVEEAENNSTKINKKITDIQTWSAVIQTKARELQSLEKKIELRITEKEMFTAKRNELLLIIDLQKRILDITDSTTQLTQKNENLKKDILDLKKAKDDVDIQIKNIQKGIQQKKLRISELENILQTSNIGSAEKREKQEILRELMLSEGEQCSSNELTSSELSCLYEQVTEMFHTYANAEIELKQIEKDNTKMDTKIQEKRKILEKIMEDIEMCKISIQALKRNVREGRATTQQELNKKYNMMMNAKNMEKEKCDKLKNEIKKIKYRINQMSMKTKEDHHPFEGVFNTTTTPTKSKKEERKIKSNQQ